MCQSEKFRPIPTHTMLLLLLLLLRARGQSFQVNSSQVQSIRITSSRFPPKFPSADIRISEYLSFGARPISKYDHIQSADIRNSEYVIKLRAV
jgi:hypothetical protein